MIEMLILSISNIICFFLGASIRQKIDNGKEVKMPKLPDVKKIKEEKKQEKEAEIRRAKYQKILENIDNYPYNQQDID